MTTTLKAKRVDTGEWVEGFYHRCTDNYTPRNIHYITTFKELSNGETILGEIYEIDEKTLCCPTKRFDVGQMEMQKDVARMLTESGSRNGLVAYCDEIHIKAGYMDGYLLTGYLGELLERGECEISISPEGMDYLAKLVESHRARVVGSKS